MIGVEHSELVQFSSDGSARSIIDRVAVEEPLEIRLAGETFVITMRTPGHDHELATGFLLAEGVIQSAADLGSISHCGRTDEPGYGNTLDVIAAPGSSFDIDTELEQKRRGTLTTSACGVCGRRSIEDLLKANNVIESELQLSAQRVAQVTELLAAEQPNFEQTGGLHAAGLADSDGKFLAVREDVGRHNAVDKAIGRLVLDRRLDAAHVLVVSGRTSFEIVQKAVRARIPFVIGVSAPSSLAISTAEQSGITLIGFSRRGAFNVYSHARRIAEG
jgi:FdhD protein